MFKKELLVSILIIFLFYLIIKNNIIIINPTKDQMDNVSYYADDINDIDFSFKDNLSESESNSNNTESN